MLRRCNECNSTNLKIREGFASCHDCGWVEEKYYIDKHGRVLL